MISFIANGFFMGLWIILSVLIASLSAYMVISQTDEYRRYQFSTVVQKYKKEKMNKTSEMILNFKRILNNVFHLKMYQIKNKILEIIIKKHFH